MKLDLQIKLNLESLEQLEESIKRIKNITEKECNCTCTLEVTIQ